VPTCAIIEPATGFDICLSASVIAATAFSMPRLRAIGLAPPVTFFALRGRSPRPDRRRRRAVAGDIRRLARDLFTICAPMFASASFRSISFATVTPSQ
jgi:hypothetical protein